MFGLYRGYDVGNALLRAVERHETVVVNPPLVGVDCARVSWVADIIDATLDESSGLAASAQHPRVLWTINDSGGGPIVYALGLDGETKAGFTIDTEHDLDWESLDVATLGDETYLVIGDVGDNFRWRDVVVVLFVPEPKILDGATQLEVAHELHITYPEGPRDVEAVAVDAPRERLLVTSKRNRPPEIFSIPLDGLLAGERRSERTAVRIAELRMLPRTTIAEAALDPEMAEYRHMPTGMDISGNDLLITTYKHAYLFALSELTADPKRVALPTLGQREAITFAADSARVAYISRERSEGKGDADLFRIDLARDACVPAPSAASSNER